MLSDSWNRMRFWVGLVLGGTGVGLTYIFSSAYKINNNLIIPEVGVIIGFLVALLLIIFILSLFGSRFSRVFLQKTAIVHIVIIGILCMSLYYMRMYIPIPESFSSILLLFLITPFLEEAAKHLGSIGLIGQDFKFSQKDIIAFTFFVVLGFVFAENLLYLASGQFSLGTWIWRSFFTLIAHIFTAIICAHFWWRALSYPLFSARYILTFLIGFILAGGLHTLYNFLVSGAHIVGLLLYLIVGYIFIVVKKY